MSEFGIDGGGNYVGPFGYARNLLGELPELDAADAIGELDAAEKALNDIINVLGPVPPAGCGCEGCVAEMDEALRLAREVLGL